MTGGAPRVALFADSFHETNGVGLTCRMLEAYAGKRGYAMLSVHAGRETQRSRRGSVERFELAPSRFRLGLEQDLTFDLLFLRHRSALKEAMKEFRADVVHVTGPNHAGILGMLLAHELGLPVVASWHTNVHEYAGRRTARYAPKFAAKGVERLCLYLAGLYYRCARVLLAPQPELAKMLEQRTGRPCRLMRRGVDCELFNPRKRTRRDGALVVGYVGRLSPEKNVRHLAGVERALEQAGLDDFRIEIAGHGVERMWLRQKVARLYDHGLLHGEALAEAYAGFDIFAFPSETDTYGNVVQEAMASGVACVVMATGGPAHIVTHGLDGIVARDAGEFSDAVALLAKDAGMREALGREARQTALGASWDAVFDRVYSAYEEALGEPRRQCAAEGCPA